MPTLFPANEAPRLVLGAPGIRRMSVRTDKNPYPAQMPLTGSMPQMQYRMASDDTGEWFEVGFTALGQMNGNAAAGFSMGTTLMELQQSLDLVTWNMGKFLPAPVPEIDNGDGTWTYWSRSTVPRLWKYVTIDETATTNRAEKSITALHLFGNLLALPNYPYAMPAAAATLQADLIALGFTGSVVSTSSAAYSVGIQRHYLAGANYAVLDYQVTLSGMDVTQVRTNTGAVITLPSYPYTMPAAQAALQADLIAAGHSGAVVMLYDDPWTIFIPNLVTILDARRFEITITPDDPFPRWDMFGTYQGMISNNIIQGVFSNVRATTGLAPLTEANKQFARLSVSRNPKPQFIRRNVPSYRFP